MNLSQKDRSRSPGRSPEARGWPSEDDYRDSRGHAEPSRHRGRADRYYQDDGPSRGGGWRGGEHPDTLRYDDDDDNDYDDSHDDRGPRSRAPYSPDRYGRSMSPPPRQGPYHTLIMEGLPMEVREDDVSPCGPRALRRARLSIASVPELTDPCSLADPRRVRRVHKVAEFLVGADTIRAPAYQQAELVTASDPQPAPSDKPALGGWTSPLTLFDIDRRICFVEFNTVADAEDFAERCRFSMDLDLPAIGGMEMEKVRVNLNYSRAREDAGRGDNRSESSWTCPSVCGPLVFPLAAHVLTTWPSVRRGQLLPSIDLLQVRLEEWYASRSCSPDQLPC